MDATAPAAGEQLLFAHDPELGVAKVRAGFQCRCVDAEQLSGLLLDWHSEWIYGDGHDPLAPVGGDVLQLDGPGLQKASAFAFSTA